MFILIKIYRYNPLSQRRSISRQNFLQTTRKRSEFNHSTNKAINQLIKKPNIVQILSSYYTLSLKKTYWIRSEELNRKACKQQTTHKLMLKTFTNVHHNGRDKQDFGK